jgi:hypothetical protein
MYYYSVNPQTTKVAKTKPRAKEVKNPGKGPNNEKKAAIMKEAVASMLTAAFTMSQAQSELKKWNGTKHWYHEDESPKCPRMAIKVTEHVHSSINKSPRMKHMRKSKKSGSLRIHQARKLVI